MTSRAWTFTINNYTTQDVDMLLAASFKYVCFGFEVSKSGTKHIQGYIYLWHDKPKRFLVKNIMPRAHLEISKGTSQENAIYTSKEDHWYEFGDRPMQGAAKWDLIEQTMKDPKQNPHLFNQYHKMFRQLNYCKKKDHEREIEIIADSEKYQFAEKHETVLLTGDIDTYDDEEVIFISTYQTEFKVHDWIKGYPQKIKRGYELITVDPKKVYIMYAWDDQKEYNHAYKLYGDYIN